MKKILSLLLALLIVACTPVFAFADSDIDQYERFDK